jgi:hypothetical protein
LLIAVGLASSLGLITFVLIPSHFSFLRAFPGLATQGQLQHRFVYNNNFILKVPCPKKENTLERPKKKKKILDNFSSMKFLFFVEIFNSFANNVTSA